MLLPRDPLYVYFTLLKIAYFQVVVGWALPTILIGWDKWLAPLACNVTALMVGSAHPTITITNNNYRERKRKNTQRKV